MKRYTIDAMVHIDIEAADECEAYENFSDALDNMDGLRDLSVVHVEQKEVPYVVPEGAQRWARAAEAIRLGEEPGGSPRPIAGQYDGSWWWSNGHVMLRCEGAEPTGGDWRAIDTEALTKAVGPGELRQPSGWGEVRPPRNGYGHGRMCLTNPAVAVQQRYHSLVEDSLGPGVTWLVGGLRDAMHVLNSEGRLMAVVMPMKPDDLQATPTGSADDGTR